ncbi:hypothetical protein [Kurthia gibsonii]|uniref:hypothetical protein n=1 Tax=Kurthia gibsonii TaxID=33946 RepID=UPI002DBA80F8|nr:hypothetical protein [Kurthia gibsonii]MEB7773724.1 hypothetical protein [Kurthia gibsonii]
MNPEENTINLVSLKSHEEAFDFMVSFITAQSVSAAVADIVFMEGDCKITLSSGVLDSEGQALITLSKEMPNKKVNREYYLPADLQNYILENKEAILTSLSNGQVFTELSSITQQTISVVVTNYYANKNISQNELLNRMYAIRLIILEGCYLNDTIQILDNREQWFKKDPAAYKKVKQNTRNHIQGILAKFNLKITKHGLVYNY